MAASAQTQAIIEELKNQGDLIRNSGTNSVRSVKLQMDRFEDIFSSINSNISQQTEIMKLQANIAVESQERMRTQEQLNELGQNAKEKESSERAERASDTDAKIDSIGDKIAEAFSLKNLLVGGIAAFAGYNLLKGFVDESTGGGWTRMEQSLKNFEMPNIRETFQNLNREVELMRLEIEKIRTEITNTIDKLTSWQTWIGFAISAIGPFMAINYYLKNRLTNAKIELERLRLQDTPGKGPNVDADGPSQPKAPELDADSGKAPIGFDADGRPTYSDTPNKPPVIDMDGRPITPNALSRGPSVDADGPGQPRAPEIQRSPNLNAPSPEAPVVTPDQFSRLTPAERAIQRPNIAANTGGKVRVNSAGRFMNQAGNFISDAEAISLMEKTVNPRFSGAYRRTVQLLKIIAPFATAYEIYRFYQVFNDETLDPNTRIARLSGILSGFMTGTAMGLLASRATMMFGPWASLISGLIVGISFGFGAEYLTEAIVKWILDMSDDGTIQSRVLQEEEIMRSHGSYTDYISAMERAQMGGPMRFADSGYNPEMTNMSLGSYGGVDAGSISSSPNFRGNYYVDKNGIVMFQDAQGNVMRASERPNFQNQLNNVSAGANGTTIIHAPQNNVTAPVSVVDGGTQTSINSVMSMGGGGGGGLSLMPYGMTSGLVY